MNALLHDPCCAAGLLVLAVGGVGALGAAIVGKIRAWRRTSLAHRVSEFGR